MTASTPPARVRLARGRRYAVRASLLLATILTVLSIFAVWADRQALNADNWAETSTALLENDDIRGQVSAFLVDEVYANTDVQAELATALPPRLQPLAGPAAGGLRTLAERTTNRALGRPRVQEAWRTANQATAQQFIDIVEGDSTAVTTSGNAVVLDLRAVLLDIVNRLGLPGTLANRIPPTAGRITIMSADQASTVENAVSAVKALAVVLPLLALALLALAVYLARGRRRQTLMAAGIDLVIAGLLVLIARSIIGTQVVDSLTTTDAVRPAAEAAWSIGTRMLRDIAQAAIVIGIPVIVAAWLAGPMPAAVALRRAAAPWLRDRPEVAYGVAAAAVLAVIAWEPIPATRMVVPVLIMIALVIAGVAVLRRQTALEFPDAEIGATSASIRAAAGRMRQALSGSRTAPGAAAATPGGDRLDTLERLSELHDHGVLDDEEFASEKASVLARDGAVGSA